MKKLLLLVLFLLLIGFGFWIWRSDSDTKTLTFNTPSSNDLPSENNVSSPIPETKPSDETGWSAFSTINEQPEPTPDVNAQISIGRSPSDIKTITANSGERVKITFTSAISDQVKIEGYSANTYVMPLGEFSISFNADKTGEFAIILVNNKREVGKLIVVK